MLCPECRPPGTGCAAGAAPRDAVLMTETTSPLLREEVKRQRVVVSVEFALQLEAITRPPAPALRPTLSAP